MNPKPHQYPLSSKILMETQQLITETQSSAVSPLPSKMAWEQETFAAISVLGIVLF